MSLEIATRGDGVGIKHAETGSLFIFSDVPVNNPQICIQRNGMVYVSYERDGTAYKRDVITAGEKIFYGDEVKI